MTDQLPDSKPQKKKTKWYWNVLKYVFLLWLFGGLNTLLLQDIPLLLFLLGVGFAVTYPIVTWLPQPERPKNLRERLDNLMNLKNHLFVLVGMVWILFVLAVTYALVMFVLPPFGISPKTTYLTEPRSTKHYGIDYQSVIEQQLDPGVPPEKNGFRLLTETFGRPFFSAKDEHWHRICGYLDLPAEFEPALKFTEWHVFTKNSNLKNRKSSKCLGQKQGFLFPMRRFQSSAAGLTKIMPLSTYSSQPLTSRCCTCRQCSMEL